jgi:uncharacterized protein YukE
MGGYGDALALEQQEQLDQQQAAANSRLYNPDGSGKANDFTPPALPDSAFPPSVAGGTELSVNTDQLQTIAAQMHGDLAQLQATLQTLNNSGIMGELIGGGWSTPESLGSNAGSAYWGISQFYQDLNQAYDMVIGYMRQSASNYADADATTASAARSVGSEATPGGALG